MIKLLSIAGARPQFIKTGIMNVALQKRTELQHLIVHTGQHYDDAMSAAFFNDLQIPAPAWNLDVNRLSHGAMTGRMLEKIEEVLIKERPQLVIVYGDTNSTLAGALAASKLHIPVAHVEAGLRSFDMQMPEEINRILTDRVSQLLFCPTQTAMANLEAEGFSLFACETYLSGDIMFDAALHYREKRTKTFPFPMGFALATLHREELLSSEGKLQEVIAALNRLHQHMPVIFPAHPRTAATLRAIKPDLHFPIVPPFGYLEMLQALDASSCVITDSGGLQKEAYFFRKPCIVVRNSTEWTELLETGAAVLWNGEEPDLQTTLDTLLQNKTDFDRPLYGDGKSCDLIVEKILAYLQKQGT